MPIRQLMLGVAAALTLSSCERQQTEPPSPAPAPAVSAPSGDSTPPIKSAADEAGQTESVSAIPSTPGGGKNITEAWLSGKVSAALMADKALKSEDIHAEASDGVVTLMGTVPDHAQIDKAISTARSVDGVTRVHSMLKVVSRHSLQQ